MRYSVFSAIRDYFVQIYGGMRSLVRGLTTSVPYLFNLNPNTLRKEVTEQYPDPVSSRTSDDLPARTRGLVANRIDLCIGCHECERVCPVQCIDVQSQKEPRTGKEWVSVFTIDHSKCVFCGLCVEVCPPNSLIHTKKYELATDRRDSMIEDFGKGPMPGVGWNE